MEIDRDNSCAAWSTTCSASQDGLLLWENEQEDACTQTDGHNVCKSVPDVDGPDMEVPYESQDSPKPAVFTVLDSELVSQSFLRRRRGHYYFKEKAPYNFKSMKEKHRENERLRHHSLNQHLRDICKSVPGSAEDGKETKVVMMQRIISYMSYLENSIKTLCGQLNVKPNHRWTVLTSSLKDIEKAGTWQKESAALYSEDSVDSSFISGMSLQLKLSSPTIDSTTDPATNDSLTTIGLSLSQSCSPGGQEESQDATVPTSFGIAQKELEETEDDQGDTWCTPTEKVIINESETLDTFFDGNTDFQQNLFEFSSIAIDSKIESPCEVKWLGSPEMSPMIFQGRTSKFGIQCDIQAHEDQACDLTHTLFVSPDKVIPTQLIQRKDRCTDKTQLLHKSMSNSGGKLKELNSKTVVDICQDALFHESQLDEPKLFSQDDTQMVPLRSSKRKQSSPRRTPLFNISNLSQNIPSEFDESLKDTSAWIKQELSDSTSPKKLLKRLAAFFPITEPSTQDERHMVVAAPEFHEILKEEPREVDENFVAESALEEECSKVLREASVAVRSKLDLRKSSWMNGFMMYSRIHRKRFIKKNPGFHTAVISKLMGHAWRSMTLDEQRPYTDKAKICAHQLQKMLDASFQNHNNL